MTPPHSSASRRALKVLQLTDDLDTGGLQHLVTVFANSLSGAGYAVIVVAAPGGSNWGKISPGVRRRQLPRVGTSPLSKLLRALVVYWTLLRVRPNIVHVHQRGLATVVGLLQYVTPHPFRIVEHAHIVFVNPDGRRLSYRFADRVLACGSKVSTMLTDIYCVPKQKVGLVMNGVGIPNSVLSQKPRLDELRLVGVGRLASEKRPDLFVDLVGQLRDLGIDVKSEWVGDGPLRPELERRITETKLWDRVRLVGESTSVSPHLAEADAFVLTSTQEGLPLVVLEAMAIGKAVIASDVGSVSDAILHGETGLLLPDASPVSVWATSLATAYRQALLHAWGERGRERHRTYFSEAAMTQSLLAEYEKIVQSHRGRRIDPTTKGHRVRRGAKSRPPQC